MGDLYRSCAKGHSTLLFVGRGGKSYWFLFSNLDKRYYGKDIPRYTTADAEETVKPFFDIHMTDTIMLIRCGNSALSQICVVWRNRRMNTVCLRDFVHKVCRLSMENIEKDTEGNR